MPEHRAPLGELLELLVAGVFPASVLEMLIARLEGGR